MSTGNYNSGKLNFPKDEQDPKLKKDKKYSLDYARAAFGEHELNLNSLVDRDFYQLRLYAQGRQSNEKYLDAIAPKGSNGKRKTYVDLSSDPISIIPKFRSIVVGKFIQMSHDITANAIDENSALEKRNKKYSLWAKSQIKQMMQPFIDLIEVGVSPEQANEIIPKTVEELDMLESVGKFKLKHEMAIEKLLKDAFAISDWNTIKYRAYEDLFDYAMMATRDYTDKATGKAMTRYVDIYRLVSRYSDHKKYDNIDYAGEILELTPNQIKTEAGEDLSEDAINKIIEQSNTRDTYSYNYGDDTSRFYDKWGNHKIKVLDIAWVTIDTIKQEKITSENGNQYFNNVGYDFEKKESNKNQEVLVGKKQMIYSCKWVVGTDYVFSNGIEEDVLRPTLKTVKLPFNIYKIADKSMLEMIIPNEDNLNLAWLKFQNTLAKAAPPGIAVDISSLNNVTNGKNKLDPLEVLKIRRETGDLLFSATTHHNQVLNPNAGRPIFDLPGGGGMMLKEQMEIINFNINMIRQITGINESMDASTPNPNASVGAANLAVQGTNNTLYQFYNAYKTVKEGTANNLSYRIQNIIRYKDIEPYEKVVGTSIAKMFKQGSPIAESSYGISLELKPQGVEKQRLLEKANLAFQQGMLKYSDVMFLEQEIEYGSIKYARMFIMYREEKYREEKEAASANNVQQQSEAIQQQQNSALQGRIAEQDNISKNKREEMGVKAMADAKEYNMKGEQIKEQEQLKSDNKVKENLLK